MLQGKVVPVSVVIPTYNRKDFILEAVLSVLQQRYLQPEEVIVIDDGSTDGTYDLLKPLIDDGRIRYIFQDNKGVSNSRNTGIKVAKGEWIALLDSDDYWLPGKLYHHWLFCSKNKDILISQTDEIWIRNGIRVNPKKYHKKPDGFCFEKLLERCVISPSAVMIHRNAFETTGFFDERFPACEDYELWLRMGLRFYIGLVEKKLIVKRGGHGDQLSMRYPALDRYRIAAIVKLLMTEILSPPQKEVALKILAKKCLIYAEGALKRGREEVYRYYKRLPSLVDSGRLSEISLTGLLNIESAISSTPIAKKE